MYLLDTMVVSALRRPDRHAAVVRWLEAQPAEALYISVITVAEIMYGAVRQSRRQPAFAEQLEQWLQAGSSWPHALMENRHGMLVDFQTTQATGTAERDIVPELLGQARGRGFHPQTLGGDKGYDQFGTTWQTCAGAV